MGIRINSAGVLHLSYARHLSKLIRIVWTNTRMTAAHAVILFEALQIASYRSFQQRVKLSKNITQVHWYNFHSISNDLVDSERQ